MQTLKRRAFTLIELLLVIAIVAALMAMLLPAIGAVQRTVMINETRTRISIISAAIESYALTFDGARVPSSAIGDSYPLPSTGFNPNRPNNSHTRGNMGAHFLVYFLMGPENFGWNGGLHGVSRDWTAPEILREYLSGATVGVGDQAVPATSPHYAFCDGFGPNGTSYNITGTIHYSLPDARGGYNRHDLSSAYYWGGLRDGGEAYNQIARVYGRRGSQQYVLLSAGPDRKMGYYRWDGEQDKYVPDSVNGKTDDIGNVPLN